jgi:hypothetical protein
MQWIRRNLKFIVPVSVVLAVGVGYLAFGVFGVHTLFIDDKVDEAGPLFDSGISASVETDETTPAEPTPSDPPPAATVDVAPAEPAPPGTVEPPVVTEAPAAQIVTLASGSFIPRDGHSGEGAALVLNDGTEQRFLRFENFSTTNGPDLNVYLTTADADADGGSFDDDFVDLGNLKGNIGDQNYEIPPDVDLSVYDTVVVWCVRFSTPFTAADLAVA